MEDDQFGNTNKQTIKQTEIVLSVKPDEGLLKSDVMIYTHGLHTW